MDTLGIFWLILFSVIGIITFIKLRHSSATKKTSKNNDCDGGNFERIYGITKRNKSKK